MRSFIPVNFLLCAAFVFLWNSGFIAAKAVLPEAGPFTHLFWRYGSLAALLFVGLVTLRRFHWPGKTVAGRAALIGIFSHGVWLGCVLFALEDGVPAGIVALVVALQPLLTGALSGPGTGEPTPPSRWLGLVLGFSGIALAVGGRSLFESEGNIIGYLLPVGSVIAIVIASVIERRASLDHRKPRLPVDLDLFYQCLGTFVVVILPALLLEDLRTDWDEPFVAGLAWLVIAVSFGAYAMMWLLIERLDATRVASLFYLGPPTTMLMAWIAFGETVRLHEWVALGIIALGVVVSQRGNPQCPTRSSENFNH